MQHKQRDGVLLILVSVASYSCLPVLIKNMLARGMEPLDIAFWRYLITMLVFWGIVWVRGRRGSHSTQQAVESLPRFRLMAIGTLFAGEALVAFFGLEKLPAATFTVLFYTYPAMVAIIEALMGERLSPLAWGALGLTVIGVILTAPDFSAGLGGGNVFGVLMALLDALQVALYFLLSSRLMRGHTDMVRISAWTVTGAFLILLPLVLLRGLALPQGDEWLSLVMLALVSTVLPIFTLNAGIQRLGSTHAAIIATFEPVFTALLALIFLGEMLLPIQVVGGAVIIASVILLQVSRPVSDNVEQTALAQE